jgi:phage terminase large subunit
MEQTPTIENAIAKAEFPVKLQGLFKKARYKVCLGGRGGAKSWGIARALLILGAKSPLRILCAREFQASIKDSVHKLLCDQIEALGLLPFYEITQTSIRGFNGTEFAFIGLKNNPTNIKSFEGVDICWVEEAQTVSRLSWNVLIPTIRKQGSEIWISFNPDLETDETYQRFVVKPPRDCIIMRINWSDNPWFPETLRLEKDALKERDLAAYNQVWEGMCRRSVDGAVFGNEMQVAENNGRLTSVPYDPTKPVHAVCDLGWSDATAWWFVQFVGMETRLIRYFEGSQRTMTSYLAQLQTFGYVYDTIWLPHDAENKTLAAAGRTIEDIVRAAGYKTSIMPRVPVVDSINAARTIFPNLWFDRENCADGLNCLRHYRYEVDSSTGQFSKSPVHDQYSHGADAFRYIALMIKEPTQRRKQRVVAEGAGWMG